MPIYEFRCLECNDIFEILFMSDTDEREMKCPHCQGENLERVLSTTNYTMAGGSGAPRPQVETKTCADGSCGTIDIPGLGSRD